MLEERREEAKLALTKCRIRLDSFIGRAPLICSKRSLKDNFPGEVSAATEAIVLLHPFTMGDIGAVAGLGQLFGGDVRHK